MAEFTPVNSLEIALRNMITDKNTLSWSFYPPLAAAPLWIMVQHHPERPGRDAVARKGENPVICVGSAGTENSFVGLYTAQSRVDEVFEKWELSHREWTAISAPGFQILRLVKESAEWLWMNAGLDYCQYRLDPDMVEFLLSRPEPTPLVEGRRHYVHFDLKDDPQRFLGPLKKFLARKSTLRAAWIFGEEPKVPLPAGHRCYQLGLLMVDPEDNSLLREVEVMAKALTPVEMEWTTSVLMADDRSVQNLVKKQPPFYESRSLLKKR